MTKELILSQKQNTVTVFKLNSVSMWQTVDFGKLQAPALVYKIDVKLLSLHY